MKPYQITASALIQAPAEQIYAILADYREGHPHILPKPYFLNLEVEQGGIGTGTIVRFQMRILGRTRSVRTILSEPEPGRSIRLAGALYDHVSAAPNLWAGVGSTRSSC